MSLFWTPGPSLHCVYIIGLMSLFQTLNPSSIYVQMSDHVYLLFCRYHSPTAYSVLAMSPFELIFYDSLFIIPLFIFPINGFVYVAELVYVYYFGLMDHSGIKMESWFPWQPNTMFHDDHHR